MWLTRNPRCAIFLGMLKLTFYLALFGWFNGYVILWLVEHDVTDWFKWGGIAFIVVVQAYAVAEYVYVRVRALEETIRDVDKLQEEVKELKQKLEGR